MKVSVHIDKDVDGNESQSFSAPDPYFARLEVGDTSVVYCEGAITVRLPSGETLTPIVVPEAA